MSKIYQCFLLGFGLGSVEGRVAIHYIQPQSAKDNFTFKCHRQNNPNTMNVQDIYAVSNVACCYYNVHLNQF